MKAGAAARDAVLSSRMLALLGQSQPDTFPGHASGHSQPVSFL